MSRRTRRKYYKRKGRWSANIRNLNSQTINATSGSFYTSTDLCTNPTQTTSTVSQQYTVKNIELSFEIDANDSTNINAIDNLVAYIMFVPQGMTVTETYPNNHPEYIMAYRFLGSPNAESTSALGVVNPGRNPLRVKTRMSRRLHTGDKIILLITGYSNFVATQYLQFNGIIRWWTKAN